MLSPGEIELILKAEVEAAQARHEQAKEEFWRVSADIPSGLPYPDGPQRIRNAAAAHRDAGNQLVLALRRLNGFLGRGEVPEDLKARVTSQAQKSYTAVER